MGKNLHHPGRTARIINFLVIAILSLGLLALANTSWADGKPPDDTEALAKASQNPVAKMITLPFEFNSTFNNGPDDVFVEVLNIKPVMPMGLTENWNLINRAIVPVVYQGSGMTGQTVVGGSTIGRGGTTEFTTKEQDLGSLFGLGDIVYQGFISPAKPGKFVWGFGPQLGIPTGMDRLSSNQWSLGPAAVGLTMPGPWVIGLLVSNVWNVGGGYDNARKVNAFTAQYFVNYNMEGGWYLSTMPVITANWEADSGNQWTVPFGIGIGRVFKIGKQPLNLRLSAFYNAWRPDDASDWNVQFFWNFLFPK